MAVCKPCRHDNHGACKKSSYRTAGCSCSKCGPHPSVIAKAME